MTATTGTVTDSRDGRIYPVRLIGGAWWSVENYANTSAGYITFNEAFTTLYGRQYTPAEVGSHDAPAGCHWPTLAEINALVAAHGGSANAMKLPGTSRWASAGGTNTLGFAFIGAGNYNLPGWFWRSNLTQEGYILGVGGCYVRCVYNSDDPSITDSGGTGSGSLRFIADPSVVVVTPGCAPVTYSPPAGIYGTPQTVTLSTETAGADIHYTVDGSEPTSGSTLYTAPLTISETTTVKAIAVKAGLDDSAVTSATFTILPPATPRIYPTSGTLQGVQIVVIQGPGTVRYTLDGSEPTASSPIYTGPFRLSAPTTVKARAYVSPLESTTATAILDIQGAVLQAVPSYRDRVLPYLLEQYKGDNL